VARHGAAESAIVRAGCAAVPSLGNVSVRRGVPRPDAAPLVCGAVAGPAFVAAFSVIGARRAGYDWRRLPVSSLGAGDGGWPQRANFLATGTLYLVAARGLRRRRLPPGLAPRVVRLAVAAAGAGLVGSGAFVTDPVGGLPPGARSAPTVQGTLHQLCALPVFGGIPLAAAASAVAAARSGEVGWACASAASGVVTAGTALLFGAAFGGVRRLAPVGGILQRLSIASGLGWLTAVSQRALSSPPAS
jgi:hypothetical protein